jgi:hypothetical protein
MTATPTLRRSPFDFSDLRALFVNCTLKPSPEASATPADSSPTEIKERPGMRGVGSTPPTPMIAEAQTWQVRVIAE